MALSLRTLVAWMLLASCLAAQSKLRKELETPYRRWLDEDVAYIITAEERQAFSRLQTDEERGNFVEQFWLRRDPTPDTAENEFKEEHYRRIAYANERFASGIPGWKTDRGRIYILHGPPAEIEAHPSGGSYERSREQGGGTSIAYPFEVWRYRYIEGVGTDVQIEFVDRTMTGEYRMTMDPFEKDANPNSDPTRRSPSFAQLEQFVGVTRGRNNPYRDLEAIVTSRLQFNPLPIQVRADYFRLTSTVSLSNITVQFDRSDLQFQQKVDGFAQATIQLYGRVTSLTRRVVHVFEETLVTEVPKELVAQGSKGSLLYQQSIPIAPGQYRLDIVAMDRGSGNVAKYQVAINVPAFDENAVNASSLVLADLVEPIPVASTGSGQFAIGTAKVRPRVNSTFTKGEKIWIYLQLYNFAGPVRYDLLRSGESVWQDEEDRSSTVLKVLPSNLPPGQYTLKLNATDKKTGQVLSRSAAFEVQ